MPYQFHFQYALMRQDGKYYNGRANVPIDEMFTRNRQEIFTYTYEGAFNKRMAFPCFRGCLIVQID